MNPVIVWICFAAGATHAQVDVVLREGNVQIREDTEYFRDKPDFRPTRRMLMQNRINVGTNYTKPRDERDLGKIDRDLSRVPTTYYNTESPLGVVLGRYNWFPGPENTFYADARMPTTMVGQGLSPLSQLVALWAEPPIAAIGLDIGTLAAYARPGQMIDFYEHEPIFAKLTWPGKNGSAWFHYVPDAMARGARLRLFQGEPREQVEKHAGIGFYQVVHINTFKLPVVTVHKDLMTMEGMRTLMERTREDGILCYHTSNRYYDLNPILASVAKELGYASIIGRADGSRDREPWRFSSDWVMVARDKRYLAHLKAPAKIEPPQPNAQPFWSPEGRIDKRFAWTDKGEKSFGGLYRSDPRIGEFDNMLGDLERRISDAIGWQNSYRYTERFHNALRSWAASNGQAMNRAWENETKLLKK